MARRSRRSVRSGLLVGARLVVLRLLVVIGSLFVGVLRETVERGLELRVIGLANKVRLDRCRVDRLRFRRRRRLWRAGAAALVERTRICESAAECAFPDQGTTRNLLVFRRLDDDV